MFKNEFKLSKQEVEIILWLPFVMVMILSPFTGILIDKSPNKVRIFMLAPVCNFISHLILALIDDGSQHRFYPILSMISCGLGYSFLNGAVWTIFNLTCSSKVQGTSMGVLYSSMSLAFASVNYIMNLIS